MISESFSYFTFGAKETLLAADGLVVNLPTKLDDSDEDVCSLVDVTYSSQSATDAPKDGGFLLPRETLRIVAMYTRKSMEAKSEKL